MDLPLFGQDRVQRELRARVQDRWARRNAPVRHVDVVLILTTLALAAIGLLMIRSATYQRLAAQDIETTFFVTRQLIALGVAVVAGTVAAVWDYRHLRGYSPVIYAFVLVLLVAVLTPLGVDANGAQRWIALPGGFNLQPSELAKLAVIIAVAALLHESRGRPNFGVVLLTVILVGVPMVLVFLEPDLGTSIVFVWLAIVLLLVGGASFWHLGLLGAGGIGAVILGLRLEFIEDYQLARLTAFLDAGNPELTQSLTFHTHQSLIAVGSGQLFGKGLYEGTQTNLAYVPENHTDFIFTVIAEEFGFVGALVVLGLFAVLVWRGLRIAATAKDLFGTLLATGIVSLFVLQVFVNVGMTIGIMPVTGIPLPFVSYGGTSLMMSFTLVGILLNVHSRRF
ncbi:MAG: rod shape-determining protein RodA [Nitriliruptorales bacterium]|nr:rod shape-determining protein RodA [Nitriliruptorales bacterium]